VCWSIGNTSSISTSSGGGGSSIYTFFIGAVRVLLTLSDCFEYRSGGLRFLRLDLFCTLL
jgi:hypothetical protein